MKDFISKFNLQNPKPCDLLDKFNDAFWYIDDVFTIDNPEFA